ncbi:unnamed protein product [Notodromas monacha]|uniref:GRAM domain-containing protein n=1 Tax=Notodromas monacha TaxID=399045 RepID=A0A7R9BK01_9CRUS|nr:unnamed protein product [Notodromas monacha]CAG0916058.1 unnamed protein product [Notodromas monacha]
MSLNVASSGNSVLVYTGEYILLYCSKVKVWFSGQKDKNEFAKTAKGDLYLTTHRIIFLNKSKKQETMNLRSFSFPFTNISNVEIRQPIFCPNYIVGDVEAEPGGGFQGSVKLKVSFTGGGAIDFARALQRAANLAKQRAQDPSGVLMDGAGAPGGGGQYEGPAQPAPPNYYDLPPPSYDEIQAPRDQFPLRPEPGTVMVMESNPPYPGIAPSYMTPDQQLGYGQDGQANDPRMNVVSGPAIYRPPML